MGKVMECVSYLTPHGWFSLEDLNSLPTLISVNMIYGKWDNFKKKLFYNIIQFLYIDNVHNTFENRVFCV